VAEICFRGCLGIPDTLWKSWPAQGALKTLLHPLMRIDILPFIHSSFHSPSCLLFHSCNHFIHPSLFFLAMLGIEPRASHVAGKHSATELPPQLTSFLSSYSFVHSFFLSSIFYPSFYLFYFLSSIYSSIYSIFLSIHPSICLSFNIYPSIHLSFLPSILIPSMYSSNPSSIFSVSIFPTAHHSICMISLILPLVHPPILSLHQYIHWLHFYEYLLELHTV
jgi:hypothetical protein